MLPKIVLKTYIHKSLSVFELGSQTSSDNVVWGNHGFHKVSWNICMWLIWTYNEWFSLGQSQNIEEECKDNTNVAVSILTYQQQKEILMLTLLLIRHCLDMLVESVDVRSSQFFGFICVKLIEHFFDDVLKELLIRHKVWCYIENFSQDWVLW